MSSDILPIALSAVALLVFAGLYVYRQESQDPDGEDRVRFKEARNVKSLLLKLRRSTDKRDESQRADREH